MTTITRGQYEQALRLTESNYGDEITSSHLAEALHLDKSTASILLGLVRNRHIISDKAICPLSKTTQTALVLSDLHIPYVNSRNVDAVLEYIEAIKPDTVILLGDIIDCLQISTFSKDPRGNRLEDEIRTARVFLSQLRTAAGRKAKIVYIEGNHEQRAIKYIYDKAPDLAGLLDNLLPQKLELSTYNIEYISGISTLGKLYVLHGHEVKGSGNGNLPQSIWSRCFDSALVGHFHKTTSRLYHTIGGNSYYVGSVGCLCNPQPYDPLPQWDSSVAKVTVHSDGTFNIKTLPISNGVIFT